jgi:hypothetical protein
LEVQLVMQHTLHVKPPFLLAYEHGNMICWSWNILKSTFYWYTRHDTITKHSLVSETVTTKTSGKSDKLMMQRFHHSSRINWTNLMSLYESFLLLNMFRMLLHSSSGADDCMWVYCSVSVCTGVLVRFGWSRVLSECRLEHCSWVVQDERNQ